MAAAAYFDTVQKIFIAFYQRPADPAGLKYWADRIDTANGDAAAVVSAFATSPEAVTLYGPIDATTIGTVIDKIYLALFNKAPDPAGKKFYVDGFTAGTFTAGTIALNILNGATNDDAVAIANKLQVSNSFTQQVDGRALTSPYFGTGTSFSATYKGDADAQAARDILKTVTASPSTVLSPAQVTVEIQTKIADAGDPIVGQTSGQTFTLTTGVDAITGTVGNDTISGVVTVKAGPLVDGTASTLTLADTIDGGAGTDTLKISVDNSVAAGLLPAASISNVENIYIKQLSTGNDGTYNLVNVTGEAKVIDNGSVGNTTFTNIDKATVGAQDITGAAANHTFTFKDSAFATTAALSVDVSNVGNKVTGAAQTIVVSQTAAAGAANGVSIAATGSNSIILSGAGANNIGTAAGIKTLTVTGSGSLTIGATSSLAAAAAADANNLAANLTTVDLSGNTGGVTMQVNKATVAVTGGAGADVITVGGAMTSGAKFNLGAGNDQLLAVAGGSIDANVVVDGGDGIDTVDNGLITVANGGVFKNFEKIALGSAVITDVALLTGSTISSLLINANAAATVQNVASGTTIDVTSTTGASDVTVGVKGAAASTTDKLTVNFDGAAQAATPAAANITAGNLVAAKVEAIDVVSGGAANTWNSLAVKGADGLQTMTITGAKNLNLTFAAGTNGTNPVAGQGGAVKSIDGSAATGKLDINLTNVTFDDKVGFTLKGGLGDDTITTNAFKSTLSGTGGNDKYVVTASVLGGVDATTGVVTTITDFNAGDKIAFTTLTGLTKAQTDIATAQNLTQAVDLAMKNAAVTINKAAWFNYGGDTYVAYEGDATDGISAADVLVKLTGVLDLTNATVASNTITLV